MGTVVLRPVSSDRDSSNNQELSFAITAGNDQVTKFASCMRINLVHTRD